MTTTIHRSAGLPIDVAGMPSGYVAGGGHSGTTAELDTTVQRAAEMLQDVYGMSVAIRFNSDRKSGGAWLVTDAVDGFGRNADIGICASLAYRDEDEKARAVERLTAQYGADDDLTRWAQAAEAGVVRIQAHIGTRALVDRSTANNRADDADHAYYHGPAETIEAALVFVTTHGKVPA